MRDFEFSKREKVYKPYEPIMKWIVDIIMVVCIAYLIVIYLCSKTFMVGNSMNSMIENGDGILIDKVTFCFREPERYDVVIFEPNVANVSQYYIKRIIGLPGETVQIIDGKVYINGEPLSDDISDESIFNSGLATEPVVLGYNEYFVLGDNRNNSEDSRFSNVGNIKRNSIIGRIWLISTPVSRLGLVK